MNEQRQTLLVVDDEANVLKSLKRLLFDTDYRVLTAESGQEGLEVFEKEPSIQLVISDYRMPEMTGVEFLRRVKELYPNTIRIILSGYADVSAIVEAINDGQVYKFIGKPWNDQDLLTTILRAFEQYSLIQENRHLNEELLVRNKELEEATQELEIKVQKRTKDLELNNRALTIAHRILDLLPAGVVGIDPEASIVYSNKKALEYLGAGNVNLQRPANLAFKQDILNNIMATISSQEVYQDTIKGACTLGLIAEPLPDGGGVICLLLDKADGGREIAQSQAVATKEEGRQVPENINHTILLLDDDQATLNALRRDLQDLEAELITTTDVHEALQILKQRKINLIISDERMPLWNGCRFLTLVEEISPETVRVMITGYTDLDVIRTAVKDAHVAKYFLKPWDSDTFTKTICELLKDRDSNNNFVNKQSDSTTDSSKSTEKERVK